MEDINQGRRDINLKINDFYDKYVSKLDEDLKKRYKDKRKQIVDDLIPLKNHLNFSLYSPLGKFRGRWDSPHHYNKKISIHSNSSKETANGFISGPIVEGDWVIEIETHGVCSKKLNYELEVYCYKEETKDTWYKGELHLHSHHSDGNASLSKLVKIAKENELDYFAISDHNTISAWKEIHNEDILVIPSIELSSFYGHSVAIGVETYIDWRTKSNKDSYYQIINQIHLQGGLFSIAHPYTIGKPICMGCEWEYSNLSWDQVDLVEIWIRNWKENVIQNTLSKKLWQKKLKNGHKVVAVGSNDLHDPSKYNNNKLPFTYVKAEELNEENVLNSLKQGKVFISSGPEIEYFAKNNSDLILGEIGDTIKSIDKKIKLELIVKNLREKSKIILYNKGEKIYTEIVESKDYCKIDHYINIDKSNFYYWEIKNQKDNELLLISNPIYVLKRGD